MISILISAFLSANNIRAFIESDNNAVIERVHALVAQLVVNCKARLLLTTNVNLNEVIQVMSYLKSRSYVSMVPGKIDHTLISIFSKFIMCINALIGKTRAMYMPTRYNKLTNEYVDLTLVSSWSAMMDGTSSLSNSSASRCTKLTCSHGFGTKWCST